MRISQNDFGGIAPAHMQFRTIEQNDVVVVYCFDFTKGNDTALAAFFKPIGRQKLQFLCQRPIFLINPMLCMDGYMMSLNL